MTRTRTRKALYLGLPIFLILVGGGLLAWKTFGPSEAGYPRKVMKHAEELHERILSFDSRITIPPDFGTEGNEFDKDGPNQLDLVKAGRGRLSGAA
ncbi:membrane dipeptidase, partial [Pseudomonas aeruginosa]|nr:membrane dipeptidase [Pseudomonas aeruginosa]